MNANFKILLFSCLFVVHTVVTTAQIHQSNCDSLVIKGVNAMTSKRYHQSLQILAQAKEIAEEDNAYSCLFLSLNNIGLNYYKLFDYGTALDYYLKAYSIAVKHLDGYKEMIVLNNIAILYSKDAQHKKAKGYFLRAYQLSKKYDNKLRIARYATNLGLVSNQLHQLSEASRYFEKALSLAGENGTLNMKIQLGLAENELLNGKSASAIAILYKILPELQDSGNILSEISAYVVLAKAYAIQQHYQTALKYGHKSLRISTSLYSKKEVYELLASLYRQSGDLHQLIVVKDSLLSMNAQIYAFKNERLFETSKIKFELQKSQNDLKIKARNLRYERRIYITIIIAVLCCVVLIMWGWRNSIVKNKQRKALVSRKKKMVELELEKRQSDNLLLEKQIQKKAIEAKLEEERLKREIENRNRKLAVKALQQSSRNEIIERIIQALSNHSSLKEQSSLKTYVKELKHYLKREGKTDDFFAHFEEVNPAFVRKLKEIHPTLNPNDIRFICYMYMNLSTKEIALLFNITAAGCRKRKERIAVKLNLHNANEIYDYLYTI